ncbi:hypothetical protein ABIC83_002396 [Roseateles asaccharophilus]|uniref:hypothetical protein n=1 Tax=Roseateles asaccharophilus TaxID=582607 RepID=UPI0038365BD9
MSAVCDAQSVTVDRAPSFDDILADQVQVSQCGTTVWVFSMDGSTIGRFSKKFGMDVHTTVTEQMSGAGECIRCTHEPAGPDQWQEFRELMFKHYGVSVAADLISF